MSEVLDVTATATDCGKLSFLFALLPLEFEGLILHQGLLEEAAEF